MQKLLTIIFLLISTYSFSQSDYKFFKKEIIPLFDNCDTFKEDKVIMAILSKNSSKRVYIYAFDIRYESLLAIIYKNLDIIEADNICLNLTPSIKNSPKEYYGQKKVVYNTKTSKVTKIHEADKTYTVIVEFHD